MPRPRSTFAHRIEVPEQYRDVVQRAFKVSGHDIQGPPKRSPSGQALFEIELQFSVPEETYTVAQRFANRLAGMGATGMPNLGESAAAMTLDNMNMVAVFYLKGLIRTALPDRVPFTFDGKLES